ncbi:MAG: hypothetical protein PHT19_17050 [Methylococcus sp.]|nr:hypothetical protein [Methylococcus sp.]
MHITEKELALLERAYSDGRFLLVDTPRMLPADADMLTELLEAGLIVPATSWALDGYVLTELGRFVLRRRSQAAGAFDPFTVFRQNLPLIGVDDLDESRGELLFSRPFLPE